MRRALLPFTIALFAGSIGSTAASAQTGEWLAWQGCWRADGAPAGEYLCVVPDGASDVRMVTVARGAVVAESRVIADGRPRRVQTEGCSGNEIATWSADYHRVFLSSELSCEGGVTRHVTGVFALTSVAAWVSVQAVTIDGRTATRTVSYTAAEDAVAPASLRSAWRYTVAERTLARSAALAPIDADDVSEAVDRIDAAAAQAWLTATGQPFQLADDATPVPSGEVTRSALDHTGAYAPAYTREVHVVERPVEVVHVVEQPVYVTREYRYRTCWDPFFAGVVVGLGRGISIGVGHAHCGRSYLTYYSPWGYDLFGWRYVRIRPILISGRPIIYYCEPNRPARVVYPSRRYYDRPIPAYWPTRHRTTDYPPRNTEPRTAQPRNAWQSTNTQPREQYPIRTAQPRTAEPRSDWQSTNVQPRQPSTIRTAQPRVYEPDTRSTPTREAITSGGRPAPRSLDVGTPSRIGTSTNTPPRQAQPRTLDRGSITRDLPPRSSQPVRSAQPRSQSGSAGVSSMPRSPTRSVTAPSSSASRPATTSSTARVARPRGGEHP